MDKLRGRLTFALRELGLALVDHYRTSIAELTGPGSFQALDASYPIDEAFWPDWLKEEVDRFWRYRTGSA